jgi:hypothetical protein
MKNEANSQNQNSIDQKKLQNFMEVILSDLGGPALGAQAGEAKIRDVVMAGGFKQFRRSTQTPFNIVYEASG